MARRRVGLAQGVLQGYFVRVAPVTLRHIGGPDRERDAQALQEGVSLRRAGGKDKRRGWSHRRIVAGNGRGRPKAQRDRAGPLRAPGAQRL